MHKSKENLRQTPGANKRSKIDCLRIQGDISDLLESGKYTDAEIMKTLGISNGQYYIYKAKIYESAKEIWRTVTKESLEYRALKIMESLQDCIRVNKEIMNNTEEEAKERRESSLKVVDANIMAYKLLEDGPKPGFHEGDSEIRLYAEPVWYDEKTEGRIWQAMTIPERKQRLWKEYVTINKSKSKIDKEKIKIIKEQLGLTWSEDPEYYTTEGSH